ncbi:sugar-binding transcriptional regulator [Bacillus sp. Marseille-P3661]|uniref:sugar-binding transcriptional regulator n=1 Tax=Bacillus sp. Marseille-P3661 TaxID=1936234 RepID=UPI000C853DC2|nr:sugar-binding transcriptional regulator [Bacillus sp. Marseille-P3661]
MDSILKIQQKLLPDLLEVMQKRYQILRYVRLMQPIGRRILATHLGITERVLRSEVNFLKDQGILDISVSGMSLTIEGAQLVRQLEQIMKEVSGIKDLEDTLKRKLNLQEVIIVAGDSDQDELVKKELGRACAIRMKESYVANNIIAVTGGSTMANVAEMMQPDPKNRELLFVPARGGLGEQVENQANTICAKMAEKTLGHYRLLHVPDQVSEEAYTTLTSEPSIKEVLDLIKSSSMVVHGVGDAMTMANRRKTPADIFQHIMDGDAVGEAFGYYFNAKGDIIHKVRTIGIQLEDIKNIPFVIAVAGGASKANAISAFMKQGQNTTLITDEGAAQVLIRDSSL